MMNKYIQMEPAVYIYIYILFMGAIHVLIHLCMLPCAKYVLFNCEYVLKAMYISLSLYHFA